MDRCSSVSRDIARSKSTTRMEPKPAIGAGFGHLGHYSAKGPVSRILSCAVIPLGAALPRTLISDLPGGSGNSTRHPSDEDLSPGTPPEPPSRAGPARSALIALGVALPSLFGLAPC